MDSAVTHQRPHTSDWIEGVAVTELREIWDGRGAVLQMLRSDAPDFVGFGECYFSEVLPDNVKAWKCHLAQTQNLAVPVGRARLVLFDDREGSSTRGNIQALELGRPDAYVRVRIPPGLWYGFSCVGETPALLANCPDLPHDPQESKQRPLEDPRMPPFWATGSGQGE
ncbi:dTDP-4-dehydrorhamnose 3,5-epimerase [Gemmatimonadota bacterium]